MDPPRLLFVTIFLPLLAAALVFALAPAGVRVVRVVALMATGVTLVLAGVLTAWFPADGSAAEEYAVTELLWMGGSGSAFDVRFSVGLDGLGLWLFGLSALLMFSSVLVSWEAIQERPALFYGMLLLLEFGCLGVFSARDVVLFYVFFESTLIPLFFLIGIWGSEERRYAAVKFFLFTLAGSVLTFLGLLAVVLWDFYHGGSPFLRFSIPALTESLQADPVRPAGLQMLIFLALFAGFAVKVPLVPLHTWLPLAHVQAPTAGSVILAGILLKIGTYGLVRFSLPMLPEASAQAMPWIAVLSVVGILYGGLVALAQSDIKRLIAYSSVSHMGFCMLGLFALNRLGMQGGTLQMVSHGLSTGALFALVGMLYERYHTREIARLGGLARRAPWLAFFMLLFILSSVGLPGLSGFVGEFLVLLAAFQRAWIGPVIDAQMTQRLASVLAVLGVVLGAWYLLWLYQRVFCGPLREPAVRRDRGVGRQPTRDLSWREILALAPLAVFVVWIGVQPGFFLQRMGPTLDKVTAAAQQSLVLRRVSNDGADVGATAGLSSSEDGTAGQASSGTRQIGWDVPPRRPEEIAARHDAGPAETSNRVR
jgi:NADH-quinone oxidoreductase subunit M